MRTIADYRQLNDALFHAGLDSGSLFEWRDVPNRLHFYVIDTRRSPDGILTYTLGVRSLDGAGPKRRGLRLDAPESESVTRPHTRIDFTLTNTGSGGSGDPSIHPPEAGPYLDSDIFRLTARTEGEGWTARLLNGLAALKPGRSQTVSVYVSGSGRGGRSGTVTLEAVSESDPSRSAAATVRVSR